jgi:hypothetical protein
MVRTGDPQGHVRQAKKNIKFQNTMGLQKEYHLRGETQQRQTMCAITWRVQLVGFENPMGLIY